jgi:hypothetical protein
MFHRAPTDNAVLRRVAAVALIGTLIGAVLVTFGGTVGGQWLNLDDDVHVTANPHLNPVTGASLRRLWSAAYEDLYIPLAYTLFAAETQASRLLAGGKETTPPDPWLFHAVSLALHAANVLLVWSLLQRLVPGGIWPAMAGALLFAVHPLQVESVAWISEQRGLLSATCSLAALALHLAAGRSVRGSGRWWTQTVAAALLFGLALLAKPQAVAMPLVAWLLEVFGTGRPARVVARDLLPWFLLAGLATLVVGSLQRADRTASVAAWLRPIVAGDAVAFYVAKLVAPFGLCIDYGRTPQAVLAQTTACALAVVAWLVLAAIWLVPRLRSARLPAAVSVAALLPVLGFAPFLFQNISTVADRYCYLAMLGPALAATWLTAWALERRSRRPVILATVAVLAVLAATSFVQARTWRNSITLARHAIGVNPASLLGNCNLGAAFLDDDDPRQAVGWLRRAVAASPRHVNANLNLGMALDKLGQLDEAASSYEVVLSLRPAHAEAHNYLGVLHARRGRVAKAAEHFRAAVATKPGYRDARLNLERANRVLEGRGSGH